MSYSSQYSRFNRKSARQTRWRRLLVITVVAIVAVIVFTVVHEFRQHPSWSQNIAEYSNRCKTWMMERKQHINQTVANVKKQVGEGDAGERVVNFEFYNTLQDMKSMQVEVASKVTKNLEQKTNAKTILKPVTVTAVKAKKTVNITQAQDLENDLLSAMKQPRGGK